MRPTGSLLRSASLAMGLPLAMLPVVLYPILRKESEVLAFGAVLFRGVLEAVTYVLITLCLLMLLSLGQAAAVAPAAQSGWFESMGGILMSTRTWIELLLALVFSIGSVMLNLLFFRMRLVPRWLSGWGLVGSVLYFAAGLVCLISPAHPAFSFDSFVGFLIGPLAIQEMVLAFWMIIKGFSIGPKYVNDSL